MPGRTGRSRWLRRAGGVLLLLALPWLLVWCVPLPSKAASFARGLSYRICDRSGVVLREVLSENYRTSCPVALGDISPHVVRATLAAEDRRFYRHDGVDFAASFRALVQNVRARRVVSGASTITQQLVANAYGLNTRRLSSKIWGALMALRLERSVSKERILENYLNIVPYGNGAFGIEAAARLYFDRPAIHLSLAQAAFLSVIPRSPSAYDPFRNYLRARQRQQWLLGEMRRLDLIDADAYEEASKEPVSLGGARARLLAPHFSELVAQKLAEMGLHPSVVKTTLDCALNREVEEILRSHLKLLERHNVTNGAVVVEENATGDVVAMVGSADFFDGARQGQVNGATSLRQPGSTLKPIVYGLALEKGWTASTIIPDIPVTFKTPQGDFAPRNYDEKFHGPVRLRTALACSYNVPAVQAASRFGVEALLDRLRLAGFASLTADAGHYGLSLALGSGEVTLLELVRAYRALARSGVSGPERYFTRILDARGAPLEYPCAKEHTKLFEPRIASLLTSILSDNDARIPAFGRASALRLPFPCAVKTGTSRSFRDNWTVGFTSKYTVGVWVGNFTGEEMKGVAGVAGAAPVFRDVMLLLHRTAAPSAFARPPGIVTRAVCPASGLPPGDHCPHRIDEIFLAGTAPKERCDVHRIISIDVRTGREASPDTPGDCVRPRVVEVYPPLYRAWMREHGIPVAAPDSRRVRARLRILEPSEGDVFLIDPDVRRSNQALTLRAQVPDGVESVTWRVDGRAWRNAAAPFSVAWPLEKGRHEFTVVAPDGARSAPVTVTVR